MTIDYTGGASVSVVLPNDGEWTVAFSLDGVFLKELGNASCIVDGVFKNYILLFDCHGRSVYSVRGRGAG